MDFGTEEQTFADTARENNNLADLFRAFGNSPKDFLTRQGQEKVYARSLIVDEVDREVWLQYLTDIDGCVLEIDNLRGILMPVRHITFMNKDNASLREIKSVLKKHVDLSEYSKSEIMNFTNSFGFQLFYERGWECWVAIVPSHRNGAVALTRQDLRLKCYTMFVQMRTRFSVELGKLAVKGVARRTLMKNDINDARKLFVLPDDSSTVLSAVQTALDSFTLDGFRCIVFCYRFGEKFTGGLSLTDFDRTMVRCATVHAAVEISTDAPVDLLWSTCGLQAVIGQRGVLSTCLSFKDCGNFQSNLDGRSLDVNPTLKMVSTFPNKLRFIQMYADLPHRLPKSRFHPVSGSILGGICFDRATSEAYVRDSRHYVSTLQSNWTLMTSSSCRLEFVVSQSKLPETLHANDYFNVQKLEYLLECFPLIVPIPRPTLLCIRQLGLWMTTELQTLLEAFKNTGNVSKCWEAYQLELASEKMLWGRPLCHRSISYSVNLGPGPLTPSRSLTDHLGFLALEPYSVCMHTDSSIPPCEIWTSQQSMAKSIARAAGLHDHINASFGVLGRHLICALLKDLHELGGPATYSLFPDFMKEMTAQTTKLQTIGAVIVNSVVTLLTMKRRVDPRMVFLSLSRLLEKNNISVQDVLRAGFEELALKHFPALKTYDRQGNAILTWTYRDNYWKIVPDEHSQSIRDSSRQNFSDLAKGEIEKRGLIYVSKLKKTPSLLPWIGMCLRRLEREKLSQDQKVTTLAFVSCIAFMMQGWFVDFDRLAVLQRELPLNQNRLINLEILSKLELGRFHSRQLKLHRLHFSIPHKLPDVEELVKTVDNTERESEREIENHFDEGATQIVDDQDILIFNKDVQYRRQTSCQPITITKRAWSGKELEILHSTSQRKGLKLKERYSLFRSMCMECNIPFRTFRSFENKLSRLKLLP